MTKKTLIASFILVLILAAGFGVYFINAQKSGGSAEAQSGGQEKEPLVKLVYTGTNETLSEALYNLDKQDGELERAYIVHHFVNDNEHIVRFIDKNNKVKRELKLEDAGSKIDVYITKNGKYAMVQSDFNERDFSRTTQYYDVNGNLLWEKKNSPTYYYVSPNGELILEVPGWDYQVIHLTRQYTLLNSNGKGIKEFEVKMDGVSFGEPHVVFSNNSQYLLMAFNIDYVGSGKNRIMLLDEKGNELLDKEINGVNVNVYSTRPLNDGSLLLDTIKEEPERLKITKILGQDGNEIYSRTEKVPLRVVISPSNKTLVFEKEGGISYVYFPDLTERYMCLPANLSGRENVGALAVRNDGSLFFSTYIKSYDKESRSYYYNQDFIASANSSYKSFFSRKKEKEYFGMTMLDNYVLVESFLQDDWVPSIRGKEFYIFKAK